MGEGAPVDSLRRIIVDHRAFQLTQIGIAIAPLTRPARFACANWPAWAMRFSLNG